MTAPSAAHEGAPSGRVRALFADLRHGGDLPAAAAPVSETERVVCGEAGSRAQGTLVRVQLRVDLAEGAVREMRYRAFGCPYTLATCEWLARSLSGRSLGAVALGGGEWATAAGTPAQWCQALEIPPARLGRLLIIEDALLAALQAAARAATRGVDATAIAVAATADNR